MIESKEDSQKGKEVIMKSNMISGNCPGNDSFMRMYRFIRDINNKLSAKNFKVSVPNSNMTLINFNRVEVSEEFFRELEKVFDEIADVISYCPLFESTKNDND